MTRGNQREQARLKGLKSEKGKNKPAEEQEGNKGMSLQERKQRDADRMREKQQQKQAAAAAASGGTTSK